LILSNTASALVNCSVSRMFTRFCDIQLRAGERFAVFLAKLLEVAVDALLLPSRSRISWRRLENNGWTSSNFSYQHLHLQV